MYCFGIQERWQPYCLLELQVPHVRLPHRSSSHDKFVATTTKNGGTFSVEIEET